MEIKKCSKCKENKPATTEYFYKQKRNNDGLCYICKQCKKVIDKKSRSNSETYAKYVKSPPFVFSQLKYQAKKQRLSFDMDYDYYALNLANKPCFYCGSTNTKHWIDRYKHKGGYTKENSVSCCEICSKMKNNKKGEYFFKHCHKIVKHNI